MSQREHGDGKYGSRQVREQVCQVGRAVRKERLDDFIEAAQHGNARQRDDGLVPGESQVDGGAQAGIGAQVHDLVAEFLVERLCLAGEVAHHQHGQVEHGGGREPEPARGREQRRGVAARARRFNTHSAQSTP